MPTAIDPDFVAAATPGWEQAERFRQVVLRIWMTQCPSDDHELELLNRIDMRLSHAEESNSGTIPWAVFNYLVAREWHTDRGFSWQRSGHGVQVYLKR